MTEEITKLKKWLKLLIKKQDNRLFLANCIEKLIRNGHTVKLKISGNSMFPTIKDKEEVVIHPCLPQAIQIGDIIAFHKFSHITVHRVIRIVNSNNEILFYTKGDNNQEVDSYVVLDKEIFGVII